MSLQNVIDHNESFYMKFIDIKKIQFNENLMISIHFNIHPLDTSLVYYLFIYQFKNNNGQSDGLRVSFIYISFKKNFLFLYFYKGRI